MPKSLNLVVLPKRYRLPIRHKGCFHKAENDFVFEKYSKETTALVQ